MLTIRLILFAFIGFDLYWIWRADRWLRPVRGAAIWRSLSALFGLLQLSCVLILLVRPTSLRGSGGWLPMPLLAMVYLWHLMILPLTVAVAAISETLAIFIAWVSTRRVALSDKVSRVRSLSPDDETSGAAFTRRQVLGAVAAAAPLALLGGAVGGALAEQGEFRVKRVVLRLADLPPALQGLSIVQVSDLHVGKFMKPAYLPAVIDAVNGLNADVILHTGDLIDFALADLPAGLKAVFAMKSRYGLAMCLGNHDVIESQSEFVRRVRLAGVPLLIDQAMTISIARNGGIGRLQLLGIPWTRTRAQIAADVRRVVRLRQEDAYPILLAHHPHAFNTAAPLGLPLTLAGHTHGGQLMLTKNLGAGPIMFDYWSGLYQKQTAHGLAQLFVSNGVGNWFPLRINAPAEIVHLTLLG